MHKTFLFGIFVAAILIIPHPTLASKAVETTVVRLSDTHVLFSLHFSLGFLNRATYVPFIANTPGAATPSLSYSVTSNAAPAQTVVTKGILLAKDATITNNYYALPYGKNADFTLAVIAEIPKDTTDYTLTVNHLPYLLKAKDGQTSLASFPKEQMTNFTASLNQ
jgi:hypothetical protein